MDANETLTAAQLEAMLADVRAKEAAIAAAAETARKEAAAAKKAELIAERDAMMRDYAEQIKEQNKILGIGPGRPPKTRLTLEKAPENPDAGGKTAPETESVEG